jgi:hypothetical protein
VTAVVQCLFAVWALAVAAAVALTLRIARPSRDWGRDARVALMRSAAATLPGVLLLIQQAAHFGRPAHDDMALVIVALFWWVLGPILLVSSFERFRAALSPRSLQAARWAHVAAWALSSVWALYLAMLA